MERSVVADGLVLGNVLSHSLIKLLLERKHREWNLTCPMWNY
jgi:hypothetical protein